MGLRGKKSRVEKIYRGTVLRPLAEEIARAIGSRFRNPQYRNHIKWYTVARNLKKAGLLQSKPYEVPATRLPQFDPAVDRCGIKEFIDYLGVSSYQVIAAVLAGLISTDRVYGRMYSCSNSLDAAKKKLEEQGVWDHKEWTIP